MWHCIRRPKSSRLCWRWRKWGVGFSEGGKWLAIAYLPSLGRFLHLICQIFSIVDLERLRALERDTLYGVCRSLWVASLASVSTLSLPLMQQWLGHHAILIVSLLWVSNMGLSC